MLKGFWKLTWVETKIFMREPMGFLSNLVMPVVILLALAPLSVGRREETASAFEVSFNVPILAALFIALGAVASLVVIISIYRESGILKRLRATPLTPVTILSAHVFVKLMFSVASLGLLVLAGRQLFPGARDVHLPSFAAALLLSTLSILSLGFIIGSRVPTSRFARPIVAASLYPMIGLSGLFFPVAQLPVPLRVVAYALPTTHAVTLMQGIWDGSSWGVLWVSVAALFLLFGVFVAISTKVFRWE
jgi:ABC-2 type transport system permease protein